MDNSGTGGGFAIRDGVSKGSGEAGRTVGSEGTILGDSEETTGSEAVGSGSGETMGVIDKDSGDTEETMGSGASGSDSSIEPTDSASERVVGVKKAVSDEGEELGDSGSIASSRDERF